MPTSQEEGRYHLDSWLFGTFRATRTIWQNNLVEDSLPEQARRNEAKFMLELSTESAEEPDSCVKRTSPKKGAENREVLLLSSLYTIFGMAIIRVRSEKAQPIMGRRQSRMFYTPQIRSSRSSRGGLRFIGVIFAIIIFFVALGSFGQFLLSPAGDVFVIIVIASVIAFFIWRNHKRNQQRQLLLMQQQQQTAWDQRQHYIQWQQKQQVADRRQYAHQEWERLERERLAQLKSLGDLLVLTPRQFAELTGKVMLRNGLHNIQHTGGRGDLGADLVGYEMNGNQVVIRCKRYAPGNSIGSPEIQKFIGTMNVHHRTHKGIFVTTSFFSQPAIDLAAKHDILLIDGTRLISLVTTPHG